MSDEDWDAPAEYHRDQAEDLHARMASMLRQAHLRSRYPPPRPSVTNCPDCLAGQHLRSECPAYLPCPYWADSRHCFEVENSFGTDPVSTKACACGARVCRIR